MAQVNWTRQLILAAALFVLGSLAYWLEFKHKPEKDRAEEQSKKVFALKDVAIDSVKVTSGAKSFEFKCADMASKLCKPGDNSKWDMVVPMKVRADASNVNSLLSSINNVVATDTIDLKEETPEKRTALLKDYGLDPSNLGGQRVDVTTASGVSTLFFGAMHPIGESMFAIRADGGKVDQTRVYLLPTYFKGNLEHDLTYWRDKKILPVAASEIASFKLVGSKAQVSGEKKDGRWTLKTPKGEELPGDIENIDNMLSALTFVTAKEFVSDSKTDAKARAALKGTKPAVTLTLQKGAEAPIVLTLHKKPNKLYATVSTLDPVFELDAAAQDRVDKDLKSLRLVKLLTSMERFTAKRLEFGGKPMGDKPLIVANIDNKWVTMPDKTDVSAEKVQRFLDKLMGNRIIDFPSGKAVPAGREAGLTVKIGDDKADNKRELVFWKADKKLYAKDLQSKRDEAFLVDTVIQDELPWDRGFFTKK